MAGIQDFIGLATQQLGLAPDVAKGGAGALLGLLRGGAPAEFEKVAAAVPGAADLASRPPASDGSGGGLGGALGGLMSKAGGLLGAAGVGGGGGGGGGGGAAGALAALASSGISADKAGRFLQLFVGFVKSKVTPDVWKGIAAKVPGLGALLG